MEVEVKINDQNDVESSSWENKEVYSKKLKDLLKKVIKKLVIDLVLVVLFLLLLGNSRDQFLSTFDGVMTILAMTVFMYQLATIFLFVYELSSDKSSGEKGGIIASLVITIIILLLLIFVIGPWLFNTFIVPLNINFDTGLGLILRGLFNILVVSCFFIFDLIKLIYLLIRAIIEKKYKDTPLLENGYGVLGVKTHDSIEEVEAEKERLLIEKKLNSKKES